MWLLPEFSGGSWKWSDSELGAGSMASQLCCCLLNHMMPVYTSVQMYSGGWEIMKVSVLPSNWKHGNSVIFVTCHLLCH